MFHRNMRFDEDTSNEAKNKTLEREIKLARTIQMRLLNGNEPDIENGSVTGVSIPARLIGGDYYDFYLLPNGKVRIILGDVMGKGIPAAMLMILTRGAFRSAAETTKGPAETLTAMNHAMYNDLRTLGSFVTVICVDWCPNTKELTYASAGHDLPILVQADQTIRELPTNKGVMIGGLEDATYHDGSVTLEEHDLLFFYTDGITEAQDEEGDMFRIDRLRQVLIDHCHESVNDVQEAVTQALTSFTGNIQQKDDITMVLLQVNDGEADISSYNSPVL
ncbi:sigma regulator protein, sensor phosphatase domains [Gracilibacillus halophilus YIM-C55.5]|uniref:Sigma regulator protein, sensor phosphatase domains n=1 Tax=Gracilibacillus halophilus YIM-C55.5 TaxID=1308866 RepID=N4WE74_9BACI|nr:PP2C family protein-serine/threonine phosphatase [Gracilibacillus halophilus]ENH97534.1 sigma regulator protein, sensor phosphatase domains [Gracilibacillus halophilus YIM-C55.5]